MSATAEPSLTVGLLPEATVRGSPCAMLLDADAISSTAAKGFRMIHFFRFDWWYHEISEGCRARYVSVLVHAFPQ